MNSLEEGWHVSLNKIKSKKGKGHLCAKKEREMDFVNLSSTPSPLTMVVRLIMLTFAPRFCDSYSPHLLSVFFFLQKYWKISKESLSGFKS